ncbi:related to ARO80 - positive transcription regulator of ARO9 and ARO10 [Melanopsichium pennsylvanicum]|uniref:Related to ARO80 - positive transcription regulator of ARO9 and ARO10 n=2 Tax=Melanopsichium pennsylvanicum TaxID=63383 RepID=A0AAJ4XFT0_9BASI|nr:related to ARO80-positive transcription regulator of ARO9 and ARO10 [Melanopsichium pennsylvanicum 4]SNX81333.1 related to ARO80 - positive transcription regulator of ARO9 and ARO10 [Melanopsichium pennsylvanicum]
MSDSTSTSVPPGSQSPAHQTAPDTDGGSLGKNFQRSFKACDGCRTKKVKCELGDLAAPSEPPCARCKREMRPCLFTMSTRGRGPKARSSRSQAFGVHHLAKNPRTSAAHDMDEDDEHSAASSAIDALAGAALASLPATNPRIHSARHDVPVSALDRLDLPSIEMIYGLNHRDGSTAQGKRRKLASDVDQTEHADNVIEITDHQSSEDRIDPITRSASPSAANASHEEPLGLISRLDSLQQYAEVGLQHSKDALRVLAGVAVDSSEAAEDADAARDRDGEPESGGTASVEERGARSHQGQTPSAGGREQATSSTAGVVTPQTSSVHRSNLTSAQRSAAALLARPVTPPPLKHSYGWRKFEPVRLKLIKRSEARYFLHFFIRQMHSFAPHCAPHLLDKSPEALSELVYREPILLGSMLSVASRYDVANHNEHVVAVDTFHRRISKWTQEKISRSFFLPASHTIGTIEALLILSEWATLDLHDRRTSPDASSDSEESDEDLDDDDGLGSEAEQEAENASATSPLTVAATGDDLRSEHEGQIPRPGRQKQTKARSTQKPRQADMRESEKFDDTAWMLTGTALRLAERLDLHNDATYSGISSRNAASRRNAERRMRVWMSSVHADCHLSVRLGRRISSPGLAAPFMNLVRDRTHPFLLNADISNSSEVGFPSGSNRAWIAFRAHAELLQIVFRTCENLYRSKAVTERLLEDEDFVPALKSIRDDLDNWANWTQPRIEPTRDMTSLRVRVEYHYARLYANGIALDSVKRSLRSLRNHRQYRASEAAEIGSKGRLGKAGTSGAASAAASYTVSFSTHPAYPFVREALAAAQSLIRILTVELETMMCAPARWFLLLVMAAVFCVKATAVSDVILPLKRCAQSLQQVITALERAAPDGVHLANRYSSYLRQLAKQLVLTDAKTRNAPSTAGQSRNKSRTRSTGQLVQAETSGSTAWASDADSRNDKRANVTDEQAARTDLVSQGANASTTPTGTLPSDSDLGVVFTSSSTQPRQNDASIGVMQNNNAMRAPASADASAFVRPSEGSRHEPTFAANNTFGNSVGMVWPMPMSQPLTGGSGSWWSTADILPGEVDPQLFLKWLDDQTSTLAPPTSHHPMSSWASGAESLPVHSHQPQREAAGCFESMVEPSPRNMGRSASCVASPAGIARSSSSQALHVADNGVDGSNIHSQQMSNEILRNAGGSPFKEDLLTKMWLEDALTDLAAAGLDMPFL